VGVQKNLFALFFVRNASWPTSIPHLNDVFVALMCITFTKAEIFEDITSAKVVSQR